VEALRSLLADLAEQRTFRFEEPWRLSSRSLGLAVPIVRTEYGERAYVVLDEIPGGVEVRDSVEIRRLIMRSGVDKPVFVRGGLILKGETQPRTVRYGVVIFPGEEKDVEALCVHDVRPIRRLASMAPARDVPIKLMASVIEGDQLEVWHSIRERALGGAARWRYRPRRRGPTILTELHEPVVHAFTTNLLVIEEELESARREIGEVIERFPLIKDQVGVAILDARGTYALELYDHPDSWSAAAKKAGRKFAEVLAEEAEFEIFKPDKEGIMEAIRAFLSRLADCEEREVFRSRTARTYLLEGDGVRGEYTVLEGSVIHLLAVRAEERRRPRWELVRVPEREPRVEVARRLLEFFAEEGIELRRDRTVETLYKVLEALEEGGRTWSELEDELKGQMSTATLSKRLKNGLRHGLVVRTLRSNGRVIYELTAKGKALLERAREGGR